VELICARWQWKKRSMKTTMATAPASRINKKTGPPLFRINGKVMRSLYDLTLQVQRAKLGSACRVFRVLRRVRHPRELRQPARNTKYATRMMFGLASTAGFLILLCMARPEPARELFRTQNPPDERSGTRDI
jgi:hypothetical protein